MSERPKPSFNLQTKHEYGLLCPAAEKRLLASLDISAVVVVAHNLVPLIVFKFIGKPVGLAIQSFSSETRNREFHFERGLWYAPKRPIRSLLNRAFDRGESSVELSTGSWVQMRKLRHDYPYKPADILEIADEFAETLPGKFDENIDDLAGSIPRQIFRKLYYEPH